MLGPQAFGQRIDRHDFLLRVAFVVEHLEARMVHRPVIAIPLRLAAERDPLSVADFADDHQRVEPDAGDALPLRIGDDNAGDAPAVGQLLAFDLDDLALHRLQHAGFDAVNGPHVGEIVVGAREVEDQLADGADAELGQQLGARRPDALEELDVLGRAADRGFRVTHYETASRSSFSRLDRSATRDKILR